MFQRRDRKAVFKEIDAVQENIFRLEMVESKLLAELQELQGRLQGFRHQKATLESKVAPVWYLPNELLSLIFEKGMEMEEDEEEASHKEKDFNLQDSSSSSFSSLRRCSKKLPFAVLVSLVCRTFREVATHTPALWTKIHVSYPNETNLERAQAYIDRSGSSPLAIAIGSDDEGPEIFEEEGYTKLMVILHPHISRFRFFAAQHSDFRFLHHMMKHLDSPAPLLEGLDICERNYESGFDEFHEFHYTELRKPLVLFSGNVPKLQRLVLDGVHVDWERCNFGGLVDLILCYHTLDVRPSYDILKSIIDASPHLLNLDFRGSGPLLPEDASDACAFVPITMDKLRRLHISDISSEYSTPLISLLRAPNLKVLSLANLDANDYTPLLTQLAGPPVLYPGVVELKVSKVDSSDGSFLLLLKAYPNLTKLSLYEDLWVQSLAPEETSGEVPCPKLETLRCIRALASGLKSVIEKRKEVGHPIAKLEIDAFVQETCTKDELDWLMENVKVEIVEPSDDEMDDDSDDEASASGWNSNSDVFHLPWFVDDDDDDDDDEGSEWETEDDAGMEVDAMESDESSHEGSDGSYEG